ncbi:uncharacterized protein LOC134846558 [Symsagittifera roscoffensis]|uniref:uncharacterized protein LOC134846558 n=1 Tax=Symsagittifera roscoffensis TaxID=84072 RepID=UPI00307B23EA
MSLHLLIVSQFTLTGQFSNFQSVGWVYRSLGKSVTKGCSGSVSNCTNVQMESSGGQFTFRWTYPSDHSTDGSKYAVTYQHVQVTQLLPNGSDKDYAIVWNDRNMGPEVREVTFDGTIMNSWNNYKIRITRLTNYLLVLHWENGD